jgi:hypothetical protein
MGYYYCLAANGRWLIFVILKNPFLHTGPSDFKISIAAIGNSRPISVGHSC